ncbi:MAG: isoprenylcysteine carboxylmethyltransferase family protein [Gammaproteobacteria bacterium]|nr:isoprenylcysteine carboxylmethyltransferase family protein [Gammaproteobacteria bacterium]
MTSTPEPAAPAASRAAWLLYSLIVLEILFMVSPIAAYYYAVYGAPLNALAQLPSTAWLVQHILPHFSYSDSAAVNAAIVASWPLILLGLAAFLAGFVQIYGARFGGRGAVAGGLYRHIRHPQYVALAIVGLGTTLFWSRFLVLVAFVVMLCLYSALARAEERFCLQRFGDDLPDYMNRTGRFLPLPPGSAGRPVPTRPATPGWQRAAGGAMLCALLVALTVAAGWQVRRHTLASLQVERLGPHALLFVAPAAAADRERVAGLLADRLGDTARLVYLVPAAWSVPELGLQPQTGTTKDAGAELAYPTTHGNTGGYDRSRIRALIAEPVVHGAAPAGRDLLAAAVRVRPLQVVDIDLQAASVSAPQPAGPSLWGDIPVPVY